jgi:hypothetical protein
MFSCGLDMLCWAYCTGLKVFVAFSRPSCRFLLTPAFDYCHKSSEVHQATTVWLENWNYAIVSENSELPN